MQEAKISLTGGRSLSATDLARAELLDLVHADATERLQKLIQLIIKHVEADDESAAAEARQLARDGASTLVVMWLRALGYTASGATLESICAPVFEISQKLDDLVANNPNLASAIGKDTPWVDRILGPNCQLLDRLAASRADPQLPLGPTLVVPDPSVEVGGNWPALSEQENLDPSVVFDRLGGIVRAAPDMWPGVELRLLGVGDGELFQSYFVNGQGLLDEVPELVEAIWLEPVQIHRLVLDAAHFVELASAWVEEKPFYFGDAGFLPPATQSLAFGRTPLDIYLERRLLRALPPSQARYKTIYASGSGERRSDIEELIYTACREAHTSQQEWTQEYVGLDHHGQGSFVSVQFPVGVRLKATYDGAIKSASITVSYRRPLTADKFWVRVGERFSITDPPLKLGVETALSDGWFQSGITPPFDHARGFIYLGTNSRPGRVEWQLEKPIGREITRAEGRAALLPSLYALAGFTLAGDLRQAQLAATGEVKGTKGVAGRFEIALANACAACGYVVMYGGKALDTRQIDFLALDEEKGRIHAVSITTSNDVRQKYGELKLAVRRLAEGAGPTWSWRCVVVSAQPRLACIEADVAAIEEDGGVFLGWDVVATLAADVPDVPLFGMSFEQGHLPALPLTY